MSVVREFTIKNKLGLHARAAAKLVKVTNNYKAEVFIEKNGQRVNGKSIMGVMMLAAARGSIVKVETSGFDEQQAIDSIESIIEDKFGEDE